MAKINSFGWQGFFLRFLAATILVFVTYNPEGYSYFHWIWKDFPASFSVLKAFAGIILLIGWIILLRATIASLGIIGIILASTFIGLAIWLVIEGMGLAPDNVYVASYIAEIVIAWVLSIGVSWSHIRRRITGQVDTDELDHEL